MLRFCLSRIVMPHDQLTEDLIGAVCTPVSLLLRHEPLIHDLLRPGIASLNQRLPDSRQTLSGIGIGIIHLGPAPKRYFVNDDLLFQRVSIQHHSHPAVTHRQHLLPHRSRLFVTQDMFGIIECFVARK